MTNGNPAGTRTCDEIDATERPDVSSRAADILDRYRRARAAGVRFGWRDRCAIRAVPKIEGEGRKKTGEKSGNTGGTSSPAFPL